jgi:peptide/nickel transport system substrate-binding protein
VRILAHATVAGALIAVLGAAAWPATAQENCVKVVGYEWGGESQSVDPADMVTIDDAMRVNSIYEGLAILDNSYQPQPLLAESWEPNADGTVWTFHLRQGVKFHDGSDFDANDVIYTYKRILDPATNSGGRAILSFLETAEMEAPDPHTVVFKLKEPAGELPGQITTKYTAIVPEGATVASLEAEPTGTGPFIMDEFSKGAVRQVVRRNPDYWQPGLPKAECLELSAIQDPTARATALIANQADLVVVIDPATVKTLEAYPDITLSKSPGGTVMTLSMWVDTPPFDDVRVRQAMKLVVDRQVVVDTALLGAGVPGNDNPIAPTMADAYRHDIIPRDVEQAKKLLAEAGHPDGLDVQLHTAEAFPGMLLVAQTYVEMARDAGIRVELVNTPSESYWDNIWLKKPFITSSWGGRPPAEAFAIAYNCKSAYPETHWCREDFDALLLKASATIDPAERTKVYQEAQRIVTEEGGVIVPGFLSTVSAMRKGCSGYEANNNVNIEDFRHVTCE